MKGDGHKEKVSGQEERSRVRGKLGRGLASVGLDVRLPSIVNL